MRFQTTLVAVTLTLALTTAANAQNGPRRVQSNDGAAAGKTSIKEWSTPAFLLEDPAADEEKGMSLAVPEGFDPALRNTDAPACNSGTALFTWTIQDGCSDGLGLYLRFFDVTNSLVWPDSSHVYTINSGKVGTFKLTAKRGAKICYGAEPNPQDGGYWGIGLDGDQGCASCCYTVPNKGNIARSTRLTC